VCGRGAPRRSLRWKRVTSVGALLSGFEHAYDRVGHAKFERRLHDGGKGDNYVFGQPVPPGDL
jgi:hypothetical protein